MSKMYFTKNELKKQKDNLKRFNRYLPTLILKKQQLQMEIFNIELKQKKKIEEKEGLMDMVMEWVDVFGESVSIEDLLKMESLVIDRGNIAGIDIPIFNNIKFEDVKYDLFQMPLWVDRALGFMKKIFELITESSILNEQLVLLRAELKVTNQRVNLFEKVKIPEARENIRIIQIYLGDQQTAAVVRGKIAKSKIEKGS